MLRKLSPRAQYLLSLTGLILLFAIAILTAHPRGPDFRPGKFPEWSIKLGLDLAGGTHLVYEADISQVPAEDVVNAVQGVRDVIERRVNAFGVTEPRIQTNRHGASWRVIVELPGVTDVEAAMRMIGETPQLDFRETAAEIKTEAEEKNLVTWKLTPLSGRHLKRASVAFDPTTGAPQVLLQFNAEGRKLFREITARNVGKPVGIFLDGRPITTPIVQQEIPSGEATITGNFDLKEAQNLARKLNAGALPVPIKLIAERTIGPSLGRRALIRSLAAGITGLAAVVLFLVATYRLPGLLASLALLLYILLLVDFIKISGITLTLAGAAGLIISVGFAVDANVLIFERLKEKIRQGLALNAAIREGFRDAWSSIRDANLSSLLTVIILYAFGTSVVRGFAVTLGLGILLSMFTAIIVTRTLLLLCLRLPFLRRFGFYGARPLKALASPALLEKAKS